MTTSAGAAIGAFADDLSQLRAAIWQKNGRVRVVGLEGLVDVGVEHADYAGDLKKRELIMARLCLASLPLLQTQKSAIISVPSRCVKSNHSDHRRRRLIRP
jgi:hypothetical protein